MRRAAVLAVLVLAVGCDSATGPTDFGLADFYREHPKDPRWRMNWDSCGRWEFDGGTTYNAGDCTYPAYPLSAEQ